MGNSEGSSTVKIREIHFISLLEKAAGRGGRGGGVCVIVMSLNFPSLFCLQSSFTGHFCLFHFLRGLLGLIALKGFLTTLMCHITTHNCVAESQVNMGRKACATHHRGSPMANGPVSLSFPQSLRKYQRSRQLESEM